MSIRIGILGLGTVGGGVVKILHERAEAFESLLGSSLEIVKVMSRRSVRLKDLNLSESIYTDSFDEFLKCDFDVVVEAIGGDHASEVMLKCLDRGIKVITANKALLANEPQKFLGHKKSENLFYEASSCGGIPIIASFEEGLVANKIKKLLGIFNGTCNYILSRMQEEGCAYAEVLKQAQELGYAEADPTFDVEGIDATHKLSLLGSLAFEKWIAFSELHSEGITKLEPNDFEWAKSQGYMIKLISMAEKNEDQYFAGTFPCLIPKQHPLASVSGANNAVFLEGDYVGDLMYYGAGAGEFPTASAIVSDILAAAQNRNRIWSKRVFQLGASEVKLERERTFSFYIRLSTRDEVGILSKLCDCFGKSEVSLNFVHQNEPEKGFAELIFVTHPTNIHNVEDSLEKMKSEQLLKGEPYLIRMLEI
jgi:homoserine dehydrogenase